MKPIIFRAEMVKAILDGRKTVTRRIIDPKAEVHEDGNRIWVTKPRNFPYEYARFHPYDCPYGEVGGILYVKEAWRIGAWNDDHSIAVDYKADNYIRKEWIKINEEDRFDKYCQQSEQDATKAGLIASEFGYQWKPGDAPTRWRSSRYMPKAVARLFLKIIDIKIGKLVDIGLDHICKEGIKQYGNCDYCEFTEDEQGFCHGSYSCARATKKAFKHLWNSINEKRGYGWDINPWVWVIEFEKIERSEVNHVE